MTYHIIRITLVAAVLAVFSPGVVLASPEPQTSPRMERAKDFIADEQWPRAIEVLKAAAADAKEKNRDEALFWLAHSQHQTGDLSDAVVTISDLEQKFPTSRWVKPARSLRVELAQKLRRADVLWWTVNTAPAPPRPPDAPVAPGSTTVIGAGPRPPAASAPPAAPPRAPITTTWGPSGGGGKRGAPPMAAFWYSEFTTADTDLRIQALGSLIKTDASRVIPILRAIALESANVGEASRAVFVLAQSGRVEAHQTVLDVAKHASESVSVVAVRELGRFGGPRMSEELLHVYEIGKPRVKYQVVSSLGERSATGPLFRIVQSETDSGLRDAAIVTLGQAGGRLQLHRMYRRARPDLKRPIITGLFNARAEDELIEIAERETDPEIRRELLRNLRLLGTPKAKEYLEKTQTSR